MKFEIGAMSIGDILDRGLRLLLARLPVYYAINLIVFLPSILMQLVLPYLQSEDIGPTSGPYALAALGGTLLVLILTVILRPFGTAALLHIIAQDFINQRAGIGEAFAFAFRRFGTLLGASILAGLMIGFGYIFCIVPGIIFMIWYAFVGQVVVVEGLGAMESLSRSKELTVGYRGRVLGLLALFFVMTIMISVAVGTLNLILPSMQVIPTPTGQRTVYNHANYAIQIAVSSLVSILIETFSAICLTLLYFDLRIRKEGFDLELAAKEQTSIVS